MPCDFDKGRLNLEQERFSWASRGCLVAYDVI